MKKRDELTIEEELFAQGLALGKTQYQAYIDAYPHRRQWKRSAIDSKASVLANSEKIKAKKRQLREDVVKDLGITREKLIQQVKNVAFCSFDADKLRPADKIRALELLANLMGYLDKD